LVRANLPFLEEENAARRRNACWLREALAGQNTIRLAPEPPAGEPVYHLLSLVYEPSGGQPERAQFLARLAERGVAAFVYIPIPLHRLRRLDWRDPGVPPTFWHQQLRAAGVDYRAVDCPGAEWRADHTFEMVWNWTEDRPAAMARLAEILREAAD
jgi:dTDP-4-amino-4,6-dideoxygalactose transaminase